MKYALSVNSGTAALHTALLAADVGEGDEVIVPSFTFSATSGAVLLAGAKPVFVDIDPQTFCMDPESFRSAITSRTRAVIPVHIFGLLADMEKICLIAKEHNIVVIEDAAQALGAQQNHKQAGCHGDIGCFSFYASKNITTGEGGMLTTNRRDYAEAIVSIRNHGEGKLYTSERLGHNYRMSEISAAIGYHQLMKLPNFLEIRKRNASMLTSLLESFARFVLPVGPPGFEHAWYVYTVRLRGSRAGERNKLVSKLIASNVHVEIYYSTPTHLSVMYRRKFGYKPGSLPKTETTSRQVFSLPVHPGLGEEELQFMNQKITKIMS